MRICFESAARDHIGCANANLAGADCQIDTSATQLRTTRLIADHCTANHLRILGFQSLQEAQLDLTKSCTEQSEAIQSLLYGPAMFSGDVEAGPEGRDRCLRTVSRYGFKIARTALRERTRALDRIAAGDYTMPQRQQMLADAETKIAALRDSALNMIRSKCSDAEFSGSYGMSFSDFSGRLTSRSDCVAAAGHVVNAVACPVPVCGNAVKEADEECDDGNDSNGDACTPECKRTSCDSFGSTFELIQKAVFDGKGCSQQFCHGSTQSGGLDLREGNSYDSLVRHPSTLGTMERVAPSNSEASFLFKKLAAATLGQDLGGLGAPMPNGGLPALTPNELEAVRLWIYNGAPKTGVIAGTADLLNACLPPADPIQVQPPPPPAAGEGLRVHMPQLAMPPKSETEVCFATYYDFTGQVPEGVETVSGHFRYKKKTETQDPLSHHLIIHAYLGKYGPEDPGWGAWTCKGGVKDGETCDPKDIGSCGSDSDCGSEPIRRVACVGYGAPDFDQASTAPAFGGSQQPLSVSKWAEGVYSEIPVKGMIVWNSHAFNLTKRPAKVEAWVDFEFAKPPEQLYPVQGGLIGTPQIFIMNNTGGVPAFQRKEYCYTTTFQQGSRLFEIGSHMHKRGRLFRIWEPPNQPCTNQSGCSNAGETRAPLYTSTTYNDPVQLDFSPPIELDSPTRADRTYKYCAQYDNGLSDPADVKRLSISPVPPPPYPNIPCTTTHCADGKVGQACSGTGVAARNASCDTTPGAGDGHCDACALRGGFTTEDEMFLMIGYYFCSPDFPETCKNDYGFLGGGASVE